MNTPITATADDYQIRAVAQKLELDRAALMEALQEIHHESDMGSFAEQRSYLALSAARANFPTQ